MSIAREDQGKRVNQIGFISKEIFLKLSLDMVPSSFEDVTRAMCEQQNYLRRNGRNAEKWRAYIQLR